MYICLQTISLNFCNLFITPREDQIFEKMSSKNIRRVVSHIGTVNEISLFKVGYITPPPCGWPGVKGLRSFWKKSVCHLRKIFKRFRPSLNLITPKQSNYF